MALQRQFAAPTYLVALALTVIPPFDAVMQVLPLRIHDPRWRFGFFGLTSNALMVPMTGLLIAFLAAAVFEHRQLQRVIGVLSLVAAAGIFVLLGVFSLDALQVRQDVQPAAQLAFKVASLTALMKAGLGILTLCTFAYAGFRVRKSRATDKSQRGGDLVIPTKPSPSSGAAARPAMPTATVPQSPEDDR
jgi:hypothetical protein